ncbi:MAG: amino acid adenylation domain-containing protein, partial [Thalassospira sp.]|uniref:amino acid adenylation domain-containing protein n=1 Tax=Thalassospira sp. TaxID=1912094 RepID=UPI003A8703D1
MAGTDSEFYPLTSPQAAIWLDLARGHDPARYNICNVFDFDGALDVGKLRQAIVQTDRENDALRLRFSTRNGELQQHFSPSNRPIEFEVIDLQFEDDPESTARKKVAEFRERIFDLENGENCRHQVLRLGETRYWWVRVYHHIVCDGYGGHLMAERNAEIYNALIIDEAIPACPFKSYRAFVETDNAYPQTTSYARDVEYWRERLTPDRAPTGVTTLPIQSVQKDAQITIPVSTDTLDILNVTARNAGTTPTAILMSLFAVLLGKITGEREPMWNLPILNRLGRNERETPGAFSTVIPYSVKLDEQKSILELSDQIFKQSRRDIRHVRMSPVRMRDAGLGLRSLTASGATFNSLDAATPIHFEGVSARRLNIYHGPADDIGLAFFSETVSPTEQKSELIWQYDANRIDAKSTRALTSAFSKLLDSVLAKPEQNIGALLDQIDIDAACLEMLRPQAPESDLAKALARYVNDVWADILEIDDLEVDENLIVAGAHSLLLPRAQSVFAEVADRAIKLEEMHEYPTAQSFAKHLIKTSPRLDEARLTAAIERLVTLRTKAKAPAKPTIPVQWHDGTIILPSAADSRDALDGHLNNAMRRLKQGAAPESLVDLPKAVTESSERCVIVGTSAETIIQSMSNSDGAGYLTGHVDAAQNSVVLLFPGQGSQRPGMARAIYDADPKSAQLIDAACKAVVRHNGPADLRDLLLFADQNTANIEKLAQTDYAQPALFITEYAKASWLLRLGVKPSALLGHSIGEYVAACLAGVMQFDDALRLVVMRGKLMSQTEPGAMFALSMSEQEVDEVLTRFGSDLSLAAKNGPRQFVVAGSLSVIDAVEAHIAKIGKKGRRLVVSRAFHSNMMEPVLDRFRSTFDQIKLHAPVIEIQSNLTGTILRPEEATTPDYWVSHLRNAVRFADNINQLKASHPDALYVECGFGNTATRLATVNGIAQSKCITLHADLNAKSANADQQASPNPLAIGFANLWLHGVGIEFGDPSMVTAQPSTHPKDERGAVITSFQPHPAAAGQWLARRDLPADDSYHIVVSFRLPVDTSFDALKTAFGKVVVSCDSFRSTFVEQNGELVQRVHESMPVPINILERLEDIRHGLFDLENGPLLRVGYVAQTNASPPIMVIAIDHICFDGQSLPLLEKAVMAAIQEPTAELPKQNSREIAKRSIQALEGQRGQLGAAFWKERSEVLLGPPLPKSAEAGAIKQVKRCFVKLDEAQIDALEIIRAHLGTATPTALWNALVLATVAHYKTGSAAIIGQPFSGRVAPETREAIGCFANVLPIAIKPDMSAGIGALAQQISREMLSIMDVQDYPLSRIIQDLSVIEQGHVDLPFDIVSTIEVNPDLTDIDDVDFGGGKFPLMATLAKFGAGTFLSIEHFTSLYSESWAERFAHSLLALISSLSENPDKPLGAVDFLPADERNRLVIAFNDTASDYPRDAGLGSLLAKQITNDRLADKTAIDDGKRQITYAELGGLLSDISGKLDQLGVKAGDTVAFASERNLDAILTMLGIVWHGAVYLPIDKSLPANAIAELMSECGATTLLFDAAEKDRLAQLSDRFKVAPLPKGDLKSGGTLKAPAERHGDDLAYVMFTSGSTGKPKGVLVPNRGIVRLVVNNKTLPFDAQDVIAQAASLGFDAATLEIWAALLNGGRLFVLENDALFDLSSLGDKLRDAGVTTMWMTASLFNLIADVAPEAFKSLKRLMSGGEALSPVHLRKIRAACPDVALINGYGPTENTTFTCTHLITEDNLETGLIPIGKPIGNTRIYVLDDAGRVVPTEVWGELYAAGDGLALGYTGAPERTEKAFVQIPGIDEERLYKTGDRVRWRADGTIEFGGRGDGQVKIRGHRIELNAIEEKLLALDDIRNVCVMPIGQGADAFLGAAIASDHDARDTWASVLARDFPDYMVPERFVVLEHLPVNANGKVDRKKLQAIIAEEEQVIAASPESDNTLEAFVVKQFETLFPNKTITAATDFFALGGHSLIAMRLAGIIEEETGYRPKLQEIFAARTPANMALLAAKHQTQPKQTVLASKTETKFALSSGQARLWVLQRMEPELAVYSVPVTLDITGPVDAAALQRALHKLEERQHTLRLRFKSDPDHPDGVSQYLAPIGSLELVHHHMDAATADTFVATETVRPFDLNDASMVRAQLITVAEHRHCLMITLHHAICDGWSMPILLSELTELYQAELAGTTASLPKIERHYEDFVAWQRDYLHGPEGQAALARWKERLAELPEPLNLPTDFPRPAERKFAGDFYEFKLGTATTRLIEETAQKFGVTAFNTLTALLQVLLYRHCGQSDIAMGMLVAGREHSSLDRLVGFFVNTVLIRQRLDPDARFESHLAQTQKIVLDAVADQAIPFEDVVNAVKAPRDLSRNPLFDVLVAWQDNLPGGAKLGTADAKLREIEFPFAKFDLGFYFWRDDTALCGSVEFDTGLFERPTIASFIERLETLCQSALSGSVDAPLCELAILPDRERAQIDAFNATQKDLPIDRSISEPFLDQVAAIPDRVAVQDDVEALSYHQFARRAAGIAELLKGKSIKPGDVVGVAIRRSVNMLAAIHGTLLSGAAYSPLDPDHPEQRRKDMLDDLGEGWVITTSDLAHLFDADRTILIDGSEDADIPALSSGPDDLAYVLFTSGSTGRPKGVEIAHRGVLNRILWMQDEFPLGSDDVILQKTPITFDVSVWELFWWSWTGSKVVLPAPGAERDPAQIADAIHENRVTTMHFVPSMLSAFLTAVESGTVDVNKLSSLRRVFASGEALDAAVVRRFNALLFDRFGTELHNLYGPTEATVDVTWQACSPQTTGDVVPIGKPIANTTVQVLTNDFKPLPIGVVGEIILGGPQIALGYRNRAELSAEKFPADPSDRGDRLYRTGDLGRWRRDGTVEYLGRIDHQVKIRGYRIEIGEVEVALESHPNVERAPVIVASVAGLNELHAFILPSGDIDAISLRDHLRSRLPEYMIPARFFAIDHLPMTSSGKVDRKALKGTPIRARAANTGATATATPSVAIGSTESRKTYEEKVAKLWAEILPDITPTRDDGFFDIGGNSLLLLRLFEKFEANWPGRVGIADLFANPTIAKQAELISDDVASPENLGTLASDAPILANDEPIAVIGMAVQVAGSDTIDGFWENIASGRDLVRAMPETREADAREILSAIGKPVPAKFREIAYLDHLFEFDA